MGQRPGILTPISGPWCGGSGGGSVVGFIKRGLK